MNHRKSSLGKSRDLGVGNGKGDKSRVSDEFAFRKNFDAIDWGRPKEFAHFDRVDWCGADGGPPGSWDR